MKRIDFQNNKINLKTNIMIEKWIYIATKSFAVYILSLIKNRIIEE